MIPDYSTILYHGPEQYENQLFRQHYALFRSAGCCGACTLDFAIWATETQCGRKWRTSACQDGSCKVKARAAWDRVNPPKKEAA